MADKPHRNLGAIYTPPDFAQFLASCAVQDPRQKALDVGVGEGVFTFALFQRLLDLGASRQEAQRQIFGAEIDATTYHRFLTFTQDRDLTFPNILPGDFFGLDFPEVEAIAGNPPYVRRSCLDNNAVEVIRQSVLDSNSEIQESSLTGLTDLYIYFLLRAISFLKPGGRLAVITADSWLNTVYGAALREHLCEQFLIERLISLDRRVFDDASVKPVMLVATKRPNISATKAVEFIRLKNGLPINDLKLLLDNPRRKKPEDVLVTKVKRQELSGEEPWGTYFKAPEVCQEVASHRLMTPIENLAKTRIGIQTLAKEFFVLTPNKAQRLQIEAEFLEPLAQSTRCFNDPVIEAGSGPLYYVFYCSETKDNLQGTKALAYIESGEREEVPVRGKGITVSGYNNKERIKEDGRKNWYDLRTALERRGRAEILIPRLIYRTFTVVWNKAQYVPGELFIEFLPTDPSNVKAEVYLAVLSSSLTEIMLRSSAQVYGAGTYNLAPGQIKKVPILNVSKLSPLQQGQLQRAYMTYIADDNHDRAVIDTVIYEILGFNQAMRHRLKEVLDDMHLIATSAKESGSTHQ